MGIQITHIMPIVAQNVVLGGDVAMTANVTPNLAASAKVTQYDISYLKFNAT